MLRALLVSVVLCVSESIGVHVPANLASFSLHKQKGRGVRAGRAGRACCALTLSGAGEAAERGGG